MELACHGTLHVPQCDRKITNAQYHFSAALMCAQIYEYVHTAARRRRGVSCLYSFQSETQCTQGRCEAKSKLGSASSSNSACCHCHRAEQLQQLMLNTLPIPLDPTIPPGPGVRAGLLYTMDRADGDAQIEIKRCPFNPNH